jgi:ferredoxin/3-ketosteroid 9alpha-monooxygenase subunit B
MFKVDITDNSNINSTHESIYIYGKNSLLNELESHSILINHNCRAGHCGACVATIVSGSVQHGDSLYPLDNGEILLCQARPVTDIAIIVK